MTKPDYTNASVQPRLRHALERLEPQLAELPSSQLLKINLEPLAAVALARGALPRLVLLRPQLIRDLPSFDVSNLDQLETYGRALMQAETVYRGINTKPPNVRRLVDEALTLRARLLADARTLENRGLIPKGRLATLKGPNGHRNIASDLLTLATVLNKYWPVICDKTPIQQAELGRAEALGDQLFDAIGRRNELSPAAATAADRRQRAYTLFVQAYDEVRRAVVYLRWRDGDADDIAPSLYVKRKARGAKGTKDPNASSVEAEVTDVALQ